MHVEARGQLSEVSSFLTSCGLLGGQIEAIQSSGLALSAFTHYAISRYYNPLFQLLVDVITMACYAGKGTRYKLAWMQTGVALGKTTPQYLLSYQCMYPT